MLWLILAGCQDYALVSAGAVDTWTQEPAEAVDVLLVVDDSCSMEPFQDELSEHFLGFVRFLELGDVDYHLAVVTTDAVGGGSRVQGEVITESTPQADLRFREYVTVGIEGSGYEMGLESAWRAVTEPFASGANAGFLRDEAALSLIFVSDEQDSSPASVPWYANAFLDLKAGLARDAVTASALVVLDASGCAGNGYQSDGTRYLALAGMTGGLARDLCSDDFGDLVEDLSLNVSRLRDRFVLSELPKASTLEVTVGDEPIACGDGWELDVDDASGEVAVLFDRGALPPVGSRISARYEAAVEPPPEGCP